MKDFKQGYGYKTFHLNALTWSEARDEAEAIYLPKEVIWG